MKTLLNLKHWQLFLIICAPSLISNFISFELTVTRTVLAALSFVILFFWMFSVANVLSKEILNDEQINKTYYFISYIALFLIFLTLYTLNYYHVSNTGTLINSDDGGLFWVSLILALYALWSLFYIYYFTARMISLANKKLNPHVDSITVNYFLAFWFYIIGIWYVQPKVNELLSKNRSIE